MSSPFSLSLTTCDDPHSGHEALGVSVIPIPSSLLPSSNVFIDISLLVPSTILLSRCKRAQDPSAVDSDVDYLEH